MTMTDDSGLGGSLVVSFLLDPSENGSHVPPLPPPPLLTLTSLSVSLFVLGGDFISLFLLVLNGSIEIDGGLVVGDVTLILIALSILLLFCLRSPLRGRGRGGAGGR